ncbi:MAG: TauD/TfdA family dioxygenase, partial [Proteobacteria bacterium]|nr:TauD/TfdA family dioxygenase [Pseudomonadota bacterium]
MDTTDFQASAGWLVAELEADRSWEFSIDGAARAQLARTVKAAYDIDRPLFDYRREDFDLGPAWTTIAAAIRQAHHGRGIALVRGLPRDGLSEKEFELLNWAIGLYTGVARPQGKASQYISPVRDAGTDYRTASGRGYSSNAKLDFHVDGCDLVTLACYNKARSGGQSMLTSGVTARRQLIDERPDLAELAHQYFYFSRQNEQAPGEAPYYGQPLFDFADGRLFGKWNRNRVQSAQNIEGVPKLSGGQRQTMDALDEILRRPEFMFTMYLEPGDLQIINNHVMLHSRTDYVDYEAPEQKRLLSRLWLAPPDSVIVSPDVVYEAPMGALGIGSVATG